MEVNTFNKSSGERRVGIVGIGHGVFGQRSDASVQELAFEAYRLALQDADALALVTKHSVYRELDLRRAAGLMRTRVLVDGRDVFDPGAAADAGFVVRTVGKSVSGADDDGVLFEELERAVLVQVRAA